MARSAAVALLALLAACDRPPDQKPQPTPDTPTKTSTPTPPAPGVVTAVWAGGRRNCVARDGVVRCWGNATNNSLGPGVSMTMTAVPTVLPGLEGATSVALGESHGCAVMPDATVRCWGANDHGALGNGGISEHAPTPIPVPAIAGATEVVAADYRTCALAGGAAWCWGSGFAKLPLTIAGVADALQLALGTRHACARTARDVLCWGGTGYGELGNRDHGAAASETPIDVTFPEPTASAPAGKATAVSAAGEWSCAVLDDRTVRCWGSGSLGMLGPTIKGVSAKPVPIAGVDKVVALAQGAYHACALVDGGGVRCWGHNRNGALGDGSETVHTAPVTPTGLPEVTQLSASTDSMGGHTCALTKDGAVWCWGGNRAGQALPSGPLTVPPTALTGITGVSSVVTGLGATCVVQQGVPHCWGDLPNATGRGVVAKPTPIALDRVVELGMGYQVICGRRDDGTVACWGKRRDGTIKTVEVPLGGPVRAISIGGYGGAALRADGKLFNWWLEEDGAPSEIKLDAATQVATSGSHTCALDSAGRVFCWGANMNGQLGNPDQGAGGESKTPTQVPL